MPPKNKKQLEQQAKRLEQQQRKRQQEQQRLQEQRKRYAAQKLDTGLLLPVSNQLITDFISHQSSFINQKLRDVLLKQHSQLKDQKTIKQVLKQMLYNIKNLRNLFQLHENQTYQLNQQKYWRVRVVSGIYLRVFLNNHHSLSSERGKDKKDDQNLLRQLLVSHSQFKTQNQQKIFNKGQVSDVLRYFKQSYFNHYSILHRFAQFQKRQDEKSFALYIATPLVQFNTINTTFIDLSNNKNQSGKDQNQMGKSDGLSQ